jgi:hypothetical protein
MTVMTHAATVVRAGILASVLAMIPAFAGGLALAALGASTTAFGAIGLAFVGAVLAATVRVVRQASADSTGSRGRSDAPGISTRPGGRAGEDVQASLDEVRRIAEDAADSAEEARRAAKEARRARDAANRASGAARRVSTAFDEAALRAAGLAAGSAPLLVARKSPRALDVPGLLSSSSRGVFDLSPVLTESVYLSEPSALLHHTLGSAHLALALYGLHHHTGGISLSVGGETLGHAGRTLTTVRQGSRLPAGTYECARCGHEVSLAVGERLPSCPSCGGTRWLLEHGAPAVPGKALFFE